jgi:hypothetical protein
VQFEFVMNPVQADSVELLKHYSEVKERMIIIAEADGDLLQMRFLKTFRRSIKLEIIRTFGLMS